MAKPWCLVPEVADKFKQGLLDGSINHEMLNKLETQDRVKLLSQYIGGDNAIQANYLFEKKVLLKNRDKAMANWGKQLLGITDKRRASFLEKIKANRLERERRILSPAENEKFLASLAESAVGTEVTKEETK